MRAVRTCLAVGALAAIGCTDPSTLPQTFVIVGESVTVQRVQEGPFGPGYQWVLVEAPDGSSATLDDPRAENPRFVADRLGTYAIDLEIDGGLSRGRVDRFVAEAVEPTVTASAGGPYQGVVDGVVSLLGSAEVFPEDLPVSFLWSFESRPAGSAAEISNADYDRAFFRPDRAGTYTVILTVTARDEWARDTATVTVAAAR